MIQLGEPFRGLLYTPFYLTEALGAFADEGLDVRLETASAPPEAVQALLDGRMDVCWGGPMRVLHHYDRDPDCPLVLFAEAVTRDPFFLVGREQKPDFHLSALTEMQLAIVSEVPTPWLCLQEDLRRAGIDPEAVERTAGGTMAENAAALRAGEVDVIQVFEPFAESLIGEGAGHIWYAAAGRGRTAYTSFITTRQTLEAREDDLLRMTRALCRAERWLDNAGAGAAAAAVARYFPGLSTGLIAGSIRRYCELRVWGKNPILTEEGFERLKAGLLSGGWISRDTSYDRCVDIRLANRVVAEPPHPPLRPP